MLIQFLFDLRDFKNVTGSYETYPGQSPAPTGATENSPARSRGASEPKGKCRVSYESGTLPRCRRPERSRRRSHNKTFKRSFGKPCSWRVYGELWFPITAMTRDHADSSRGAGVFFHFCCKQTHLPQIDPWVTPKFPLGHPEFSTGSPKILLGSHKRSSFCEPRALCGCCRASPITASRAISAICIPPGTHSSPVIPTHRPGWASNQGRSVQQRVALEAARRFNGGKYQVE